MAAFAIIATCAALLPDGVEVVAAPAQPPHAQFQTSDRCIACHNGMLNSAGDEYSIGLDWQASIMANSSRDPYWQGSLRREVMDHAPAGAAIEHECSACHMPIPEYQAREAGLLTKAFGNLPGAHADKEHADGVSCSVCHQITPERLGTEASFNGKFVVAAGEGGRRPEFGPYPIDPGLQLVMHSSTSGYHPQYGAQIQSAELCASCHTLITEARDAAGKVVGSLPEQMPFQEWQHSDYKDQRTCQACHMPAVEQPMPIARILAEPRPGARRHQFIGANFVMQDILGRHHDELAVAAESRELYAAAERTAQYLQREAATLTLAPPTLSNHRLVAQVTVDNLGGHKLPTAFPARRAWLHLLVRDAAHRVVFESGALQADGSIKGNDNDADPGRFEPHYREIRTQDQVQIYESILGDPQGRVTTGLLAATHYLKDNRLLPHGFDKDTAAPDIAVQGEARADPGFTGRGHTIRYSIDVADGAGPFVVETELWYQPIGFRWAHNLQGYAAEEPRRFVGYYDEMGVQTAVRLAAVSGSVR